MILRLWSNGYDLTNIQERIANYYYVYMGLNEIEEITKNHEVLYDLKKQQYILNSKLM